MATSTQGFNSNIPTTNVFGFDMNEPTTDALGFDSNTPTTDAFGFNSNTPTTDPVGLDMNGLTDKFANDTIVAHDSQVSYIVLGVCGFVIAYIIIANSILVACFFLNRRERWNGFTWQVFSLVINDLLVGLCAIPMFVVNDSTIATAYITCAGSFYLQASSNIRALFNVFAICLYRFFKLKNINKPATPGVSHNKVQSIAMLVLFWIILSVVTAVPFIMWSDPGEYRLSCQVESIFGNDQQKGRLSIAALHIIPLLLTNFIYMGACILLCCTTCRNVPNSQPNTTDMTASNPTPTEPITNGADVVSASNCIHPSPMTTEVSSQITSNAGCSRPITNDTHDAPTSSAPAHPGPIPNDVSACVLNQTCPGPLINNAIIAPASNPIQLKLISNDASNVHFSGNTCPDPIVDKATTVDASKHKNHELTNNEPSAEPAPNPSRSRQINKAPSSINPSLRYQKQIFGTIGILVLLLNLFSIPPPIVVLYHSFGGTLSADVKYLILNIFLFNSAANQFVYALRIKGIKDRLAKIFQACTNIRQ